MQKNNYYIMSLLTLLLMTPTTYTINDNTFMLIEWLITTSATHMLGFGTYLINKNTDSSDQTATIAGHAVGLSFATFTTSALLSKYASVDAKQYIPLSIINYTLTYTALKVLLKHTRYLRNYF